MATKTAQIMSLHSTDCHICICFHQFAFIAKMHCCYFHRQEPQQPGKLDGAVTVEPICAYGVSYKYYTPFMYFFVLKSLHKTKEHRPILDITKQTIITLERASNETTEQWIVQQQVEVFITKHYVNGSQEDEICMNKD